MIGKIEEVEEKQIDPNHFFSVFFELIFGPCLIGESYQSIHIAFLHPGLLAKYIYQ